MKRNARSVADWLPKLTNTGHIEYKLFFEFQMNRVKTITSNLVSAALCSLLFAGNAFSVGPLVKFENFPVTGATEYPADSTDGLWKYSSGQHNTFFHFYGSCGYWNTDDLDDHPGVNEFFNLYKNSYNNAHMGWTSHAFFEIDDKVAISGKSLKITVTGGVTETGTHGLPLFNKEDYLDLVNAGKDPVAHDGVRLKSDARLYFINESYNNGNYPLRAAAGANTFSYYVYLPEGITNKSSSPNSGDLAHNATMHTGPFNASGGHFYHTFYVSGGGWIHVNQGAHPQHNNSFDNASKYPYPSMSIRDYGTSYYNTMYAMYLALGSYYEGALPQYNIWFDEPTFLYDSYPQNNETINSTAIGYYPKKDNLFELSFEGKYKNNAYSNATYEIRYSFSQMTNENWTSAKPVNIQTDSYYKIPARADGIMKKVNAWRQTVWVPFKLQAEDVGKLTAGTTVYFAIKDVSQNPNNLQVPNPLYNSGRQYANYPDLFDFAGDKVALSLIKRIDFFIASSHFEEQDPFPIINSMKIIQVN